MLVVEVQADETYWPAAQVPHARHTVSAVAVQAEEMYWPAGHAPHGVGAEDDARQKLFEVQVTGADVPPGQYFPAGHGVCVS
jgi:hypothetical protein